MASTDQASAPKRSYRATLGNMGMAQKPGRGAPPYSRWINRRLGKYLAAAAYVIGLTPVQVTIISACFTLAALVLVIVVAPVWWLGILVAVLLLLGYALDSADGQLARVRGGGGQQGERRCRNEYELGVRHNDPLRRLLNRTAC